MIKLVCIPGEGRANAKLFLQDSAWRAEDWVTRRFRFPSSYINCLPWMRCLDSLHSEDDRQNQKLDLQKTSSWTECSKSQVLTRQLKIQLFQRFGSLALGFPDNPITYQDSFILAIQCQNHLTACQEGSIPPFPRLADRGYQPRQSPAMPPRGEKDLYNAVKTHLVKEGTEIQLLCRYFSKKRRRFKEKSELSVHSSPLFLPSLQDTLLPDD